METKGYMFESGLQAERSGQWAKIKKSKGKESFGWDVFNQDSLYRAYKKRTAKLEREMKDHPELFEKMTEEERLDRMADEIEQQIEKRGQFSRKRVFVEEKDVDYINERNRRFNQKLERNYSKYASEIKQNLERGTAL